MNTKKVETVPVKRAEETHREVAHRETDRPVLSGPWGLLDELRNEMDTFWGAPFRFPTFGNFGRSFGVTPTTKTAQWMPHIDIYRDQDHLMVKADLPGLTKDDVEVTIDENGLLLKGERKEEKETKEDDFYRCERSYGSFYRHIPLPRGINVDKIKAKVADGVLQVTVPLPEAAKSHPTKVKVA